MIFTFSGVDCSGKTTQIERARHALVERGHRVQVFWFRPGYSPELDRVRSLVRRLRPSALPKPGASGERDRAFSRPAVRRAWIATALADTVVQLAGKVRAHARLGRVVLCDRYLYDAMLDLELRFDELAPVRASLERALRLVCPTPARRFLLMLPHDVMLERMERKAEPFPDAPAVRDARFARYRSWAERGDFDVIDAATEVEAVHEDVLRRLLSALEH